MYEFFKKEFYGNTVSQWLIALFIILGAFIVGRIVYWFFTKIVRIFTSRTKTRLDDILIDKIEEPVVVGIVVAGIWYGLSFLTIAPDVAPHIGNAVMLTIIMNLAWLVVRTIDALIEEYIVPVVEKSESNLDDAILPIARRGFSVVIWVVAVVVGLNNAGYDVAAILTGLGIGGLALAIGARTTIMNIFGGITVLVTQPFKIGDRIMIDGYDGYVLSIGLGATRIKTFIDNFIVTIPNRVFSDSEIVNVTEALGIKIDLQIHVPVNIHPPVIQEVLDHMKKVVKEHPCLNDDQKISVRGLDDFGIILQCICYVTPGKPYWQTRSDVAIQTLTFMQQRGVPVATRNGLNYYPEDIQQVLEKPKMGIKALKKDKDDDGLF
jgi:MscS family membrane protein